MKGPYGGSPQVFELRALDSGLEIGIGQVSFIPLALYSDRIAWAVGPLAEPE